MNANQKSEPKNHEALNIGGVGDMCSSHTPHFEDSYIKHYEWAESQAKKGLQQKQCDKCKYWFFPSEF